MFIDAIYKPKDSMVSVVERVNGKRVFKDYDANYTFYIEDPRGNYRTIYGTPVKKITCKDFNDYQKQKRIYSSSKTYESDVNPLGRCIEDHYPGDDVPVAQVAFFDIETDFDQVLGYSSPEEAFNPITSVAVYLQWKKQMICLAVPPPTLTLEEAKAIAEQVGDTYICETEEEMLDIFLDVIEDADVLSGWNSELYDIPYTINRITMKLGKEDTKRTCLWGMTPKKKYVERFGKENQTYDLSGRIHLDYLELYKKYTYEERHSYALNAIAEIELNEQKVDYEGTLDDLYKKDFPKFLEYNIKDTFLLHKLDLKMQYIELANTIAHANCATIQQTMGTVAMTDQAIMVEAHQKGMVVHDKKRSDPNAMKAAGGWVQEPRKGLHKWVGSTDLNSLYPSVIRAWNMSNETIIGQVRTDETNSQIKAHIDAAKANTFAGWWNDRFTTIEMQRVFDQNEHETVWVDFEDGNSYELTGKDVHNLIFNETSDWCISANGTIFSVSKPGIIPSLLTRWYKERKIMQGYMKGYKALKFSDIADDGIPAPDASWYDESSEYTMVDPFDVNLAFNRKTLEAFIAEDDKEGFNEYMHKHGLYIKQGKVTMRDTEKLKELTTYWDKRQLVKKINLNSLYGGLLNEHSRFYDQRLGQSTTLSGRCITRHMAAKVNELFTGEYDHCGQSIIYGDTDSVYFSAYPVFKDDIDAGKIEWSKEKVTEIYDTVGEVMNATFNDFAWDTFKVPNSYADGVLGAGREIVASSALYIVKKRYAALVYDDEGNRKDIDGKPGKLKAMGLDLRRSDTPVRVQNFLSKILMEVLTDHTEDQVIESIRTFKEEFEALKSWEKGAPKAVNNLSKYRDMLNDYREKKRVNFGGGKVDKPRIPGHVLASLNWNELREERKAYHIPAITDGQKIIVCKLKESMDNDMTSIAYPVDESHLPDWFTSLPFDDEGMMESVVDKKVENLLKTLDWDLRRTSKTASIMETLFDFGK